MLDPIDIHVHAGTHGQDGRLPISHDAHYHALVIKVSIKVYNSTAELHRACQKFELQMTGEVARQGAPHA
jgi:hypothetical protein